MASPNRAGQEFFAVLGGGGGFSRRDPEPTCLDRADTCCRILARDGRHVQLTPLLYTFGDMGNILAETFPQHRKVNRRTQTLLIVMVRAGYRNWTLKSQTVLVPRLLLFSENVGKDWHEQYVNARQSHGCARCKYVACTPRLAVVGACIVRCASGKPYKYLHVLLTYGKYRYVLARKGAESAARTQRKFYMHLKCYDVSACSQVSWIPYGRQHATARTAGCDRGLKLQQLRVTRGTPPSLHPYSPYI
ncbi:hypothetical protein Bbelb_342610 [Branchiostoma belcheri]|nr:hypothetical protein Bbelb_342610 [Branchiostoma belcheri]